MYKAVITAPAERDIAGALDISGGEAAPAGLAGIDALAPGYIPL